MGTGVGGGARFRDRSPSVKRKAGEEHTPQGEDSDGFRKPGRPRQRKTANGTSQVQVDNVGEYVVPAEFYIGNTDSRTNPYTIKTVLLLSAAAVES